MRALNLVTTRDSPFFQDQVRTLESLGVASEILALDETRPMSDDGYASRSVSDYVRYYPRVLRESFGSYDLIHANYGLTAPAALAQPNLPVVLSLWGSDLMGKYGRVSKACARLADEVIVMSEEMAREVGTDCHVIPHGVDLAKFEPKPQAAARADVGWDSNARHVLFPYHPSREVKDFPRAERVVDAVREQFDGDVELQTVSGIPHERVVDYMSAADALLLTSKREGSPNSVKEAMACNLPVVATDVGDVSERLDGVSPSTVAQTDEGLVDGLLAVLKTDERSNGREKVRRELSHDVMGTRLHEVYVRALTD